MREQLQHVDELIAKLKLSAENDLRLSIVANIRALEKERRKLLHQEAGAQ